MKPKLKPLKMYVARCKQSDCSLVLFLGKPRLDEVGCWEGGPNAIRLMNLNLKRFPGVKPGKCVEVGLFVMNDLRIICKNWNNVKSLKHGGNL